VVSGFRWEVGIGITAHADSVFVERHACALEISVSLYLFCFAVACESPT
jgi:hypothetical protein